MTDEEVEGLLGASERLGEEIGEIIKLLDSRQDIDKRSLAIAKTEMQTGLMWMKRSILRPDVF